MKPSHNTIPTHTILTIHDSPRNSSNTHLTTEPHVSIPTHQSPRHQTVKHSTFIGSPAKPGSAPENKQRVPGSVVAKELKTGGHFFHIIDEMRGVRKTSESKLQKTRDEITRIEHEAPEEKLEWKKMVETGQYIRIRRQEEKEKKDKDNKEAVWVSGRVLSKEREYKAFRNKVIDFKYDLKHRKDVIKYLTSREPLNPEILAQPLYSCIDAKDIKPPTTKRESIRMISSARTPPTNFEEVKHELANLHFNMMESPVRQEKQEKDFLLIYNQEQLKKLKGGITYMNKWKSKHRPKITTTSYRSDGPLDIDDQEDEIDRSPRSPLSPKSPKSPKRDMMPSSPIVIDNKKKTLSRKQTIEERALNLDPHKEFLRKIGLPSHPVSRKSSKLGLFLTSVDAGLFKETMENKLESLFGRETISITSKNRNELDTEGPQSPNGFFFPSRSKNVSPVAGTNNDPSYSDMFKTSIDNNNMFKKFSESARMPQKRMSLGGTNTSWSPRKQNWALKESPQGKAMIFSSKSKMKAEMEKDALLRRYTNISTNCSANVRDTVDLKSSLNKEFGLLRGQLIKIGDVKTQDNEIETRIKQDMYAEIQNQYTIAANAGNAGKNKHIRKSASESKNKREKW